MKLVLRPEPQRSTLIVGSIHIDFESFEVELVDEVNLWDGHTIIAGIYNEDATDFITAYQVELGFKPKED